MKDNGLRPGDRFVVAEPFALPKSFDVWPAGALVVQGVVKRDDVTYRGDPNSHPSDPDLIGRWRLGRFIPTALTRTTCEVTDYRAHQLQTLTDEEATAEGIYPDQYGGFIGPTGIWDTPRKAFTDLWTSIHNEPGERWQDNPELHAYTFKVVR